MTNVAPFKAIPIDSSGSPKWGSWVYGHCTLGPLSRASTISGPDCTEIPICFETLCRFTGVYSGNVGIYEQDLVYRNGTFGVVECYLVPNPNGDFNHVYKIRWYGCNSNLYTDDLSYWSDMVTVVGNVYEPRWCEFMNIYCTYDRNSTLYPDFVRYGYDKNSDSLFTVIHGDELPKGYTDRGISWINKSEFIRRLFDRYGIGGYIKNEES